MPAKQFLKEEELKMLRVRSRQLKQQLGVFFRHIDDLDRRVKQGSAKVTKLRAFVDETKCTGCGICSNVCPWGAIEIDNIASVDALRCTGCGICIRECPNRAISLKIL